MLGLCKGVISTSIAPDVIHPHIRLTENSVCRQVLLRVHVTGGSRWAVQLKVVGKVMNIHSFCVMSEFSECLTSCPFSQFNGVPLDPFTHMHTHTPGWSFHNPFHLLTSAPLPMKWSSVEMKLGLEDTPEAQILNHVLSVGFVTCGIFYVWAKKKKSVCELLLCSTCKWHGCSNTLYWQGRER